MIKPRVSIASLSGQSDTKWATAVEDHIGAAFLGGIAIDNKTRSVAQQLVSRGRTEFLPSNPIQFIESQLREISDSQFLPAFNVRSTSLPPIRKAAATCEKYGAVIEINAHCRQNEMYAIGTGEALLCNADELERQVTEAATTGATVSVKVRAEVDGVNLVEIANLVSEAGATILHIDAMDSEKIIMDVASASNTFIIANNGVRGRETFMSISITGQMRLVLVDLVTTLLYSSGFVRLPMSGLKTQ